MNIAAPIDLQRALHVAKDAASRAAEIELRWFAKGVAVEIKADLSPVTAADREAEAAIREVITTAFPDHDFLGEESGTEVKGSRYRWVVDPLDGTKGFTRGGAFWGPLIGLLEDGQAVVGVMAMPVSGDVFAAARGLGATKNGRPIRVSSIASWSQATLSLGEMKHLFAPPRTAAMVELLSTCASTRCYGDLAGAAMVLEGKADVWLEAGVQIWDLAPLQILAQEACGRFTDLEGRPTVAAGNAILSNGLLHAHALTRLARTP